MENGVNEGRALERAGGKMENASPRRPSSTDFDHNADFITFDEDYEDELGVFGPGMDVVWRVGCDDEDGSDRFDLKPYQLISFSHSFPPLATHPQH